MLNDFDGLLRWPALQEWIDAQADIPGKGDVRSVRQLIGGTQNNLFVIERDGGSFVLRRPPRNLRKNSNATMLREARLLGALKDSYVPHARLYASCADEAVIGTAFYAMAPLEGFSPLGPLPGQYGTDPSWRAAMGREYVKAGAALGAVDYVAQGLEDYGKPTDWHGRQVDRWRGQLDSYVGMPGYDGPSLPHIDEISRWLSDNVPTDGRIGIIHGDFQYPNVMYRFDRPAIAGLIDWELSTLGDPLLDLGWMLSSWYEAGDPDGKEPVCTPWNGFATRRELVSLYGELSGRDMSQMPWYMVLACFKLASIQEGTFARSRAGLVPAELGNSLHGYALWLLEKARQVMATGNV